MNGIKYICPNCGIEFEQGDWNYNYETAQLDFECPVCEWQGTENEVEIVELKEETFSLICAELNSDLILRKAQDNKETPFGFVIGYIRDNHNIPKVDAWDIADKVLKHFELN